jgi:hypothetical protein
MYIYIHTYIYTNWKLLIVVAAAANEVYKAAKMDGFGDADFSAVLEPRAVKCQIFCRRGSIPLWVLPSACIILYFLPRAVPLE